MTKQLRKVISILCAIALLFSSVMMALAEETVPAGEEAERIVTEEDTGKAAEEAERKAAAEEAARKAAEEAERKAAEEEAARKAAEEAARKAAEEEAARKAAAEEAARKAAAEEAARKAAEEEAARKAAAEEAARKAAAEEAARKAAEEASEPAEDEAANEDAEEETPAQGGTEENVPEDDEEDVIPEEDAPEQEEEIPTNDEPAADEDGQEQEGNAEETEDDEPAAEQKTVRKIKLSVGKSLSDTIGSAEELVIKLKKSKASVVVLKLYAASGAAISTKVDGKAVGFTPADSDIPSMDLFVYELTGAAGRSHEIVLTSDNTVSFMLVTAKKAVKESKPKEEKPADEAKPTVESSETPAPSVQASVKTYDALKAGSRISDTLVAGQKAKIQVKCGRNESITLTLKAKPAKLKVLINGYDAEFVNVGNGTYTCELNNIAFRKFNVVICAKQDLSFTLTAEARQEVAEEIQEEPAEEANKPAVENKEEPAKEENKPAEEKQDEPAEEMIKPAEETEEKPVEDTEKEPAEQTEKEPAEQNEEEPAEETEEEPAEETEEEPAEGTEEEPAEQNEEEPAEETEEEPAERTEEEPAEQNEEEPAEGTEEEPAEGTEEEPAEEIEEEPAEGTEEEPAEEIEEEPAEETEEEPAEETEEEPAEETEEEPAEETEEEPAEEENNEEALLTELGYRKVLVIDPEGIDVFDSMEEGAAIAAHIDAETEIWIKDTEAEGWAELYTGDETLKYVRTEGVGEIETNEEQLTDEQIAELGYRKVTVLNENGADIYDSTEEEAAVIGHADFESELWIKDTEAEGWAEIYTKEEISQYIRLEDIGEPALTDEQLAELGYRKVQILNQNGADLYESTEEGASVTGHADFESELWIKDAEAEGWAEVYTGDNTLQYIFLADIEKQMPSDEEMLAMGYIKVFVGIDIGANVYGSVDGEDIVEHLDADTELWVKLIKRAERALIFDLDEEAPARYIALVDIIATMKPEGMKELPTRELAIHSSADDLPFIFTGTTVTFDTELINFLDDDAYTVQWKYSEDGEEYTDIENANELSYEFVVDMENAAYFWKVSVILITPPVTEA